MPPPARRRRRLGPMPQQALPAALPACPRPPRHRRPAPAAAPRPPTWVACGARWRAQHTAQRRKASRNGKGRARDVMLRPVGLICAQARHAWRLTRVSAPVGGTERAAKLNPVQLATRSSRPCTATRRGLAVACCMQAAERSQRVFSAVSRVFVRFASKKQGGSTTNGRDSQPKFLGLKASGGEVRLPRAPAAPRPAVAARWHARLGLGLVGAFGLRHASRGRAPRARRAPTAAGAHACCRPRPNSGCAAPRASLGGF